MDSYVRKVFANCRLVTNGLRVSELPKANYHCIPSGLAFKVWQLCLGPSRPKLADTVGVQLVLNKQKGLIAPSTFQFDASTEGHLDGV